MGGRVNTKHSVQSTASSSVKGQKTQMSQLNYLSLKKNEDDAKVSFFLAKLRMIVIMSCGGCGRPRVAV